jgi:hypothetical protein
LKTKNSNRDENAKSLYKTAGGDRMAAGAASMAAGDAARGKAEKADNYLEAWRNFRRAKIDFDNAGDKEGVLRAQGSMNDANEAAHPKAKKKN